MIIKEHIGYRFLTDKNVVRQLLMETYPTYDNSPVHPQHQLAVNLIQLLAESKDVIVTADRFMQEIANVQADRRADGTYDWSIFKNLMDRKATILYTAPHEGILRVVVSGKYICFGSVIAQEKLGEGNMFLGWTMLYIDRSTGKIVEKYGGDRIPLLEDLIYRLMIVLFHKPAGIKHQVAANGRYGVRKTGKLGNSLSFPVNFITAE